MVKLILLFVPSGPTTLEDTREDLERQQFLGIVYLLVGVAWLIGSIFFIPSTRLLAVGAWIFIWSSLVSAVSSGFNIHMLLKRLNRTKIVHVDADVDGKGGALTYPQSLHRQLLPDGAEVVGDEGLSRDVLYERLISKVYVLCAASFVAGALIFIVGSIFFLPLEPSKDGTSEEFSLAGCWLFELGSAFFLFGSVLSLLVVKEVAMTSDPIPCPSKKWWMCPSWSDQSLNLTASWMYVDGAIMFLVGTGVIYPREFVNDGRSTTHVFYLVGTALFVLGSLGFLFGAILDSILAERRLMRHTA